MTDRTTLRLDDERKKLLDEASTIVARDEHDDPPRSEVIDAALTHLIQSRENMDDARDELAPRTIQRFNTDVLALKYRTSIEERWR
jgi:metal-responsive CopG/Arc/MetJ family transcriptional regulator